MPPRGLSSCPRGGSHPAHAQPPPPPRSHLSRSRGARLEPNPRPPTPGALAARLRARGIRPRGLTSPVRMMTEVVPSPTSSSWARESSIMLLAAGWLTSTWAGTSGETERAHTREGWRPVFAAAQRRAGLKHPPAPPTGRSAAAPGGRRRLVRKEGRARRARAARSCWPPQRWRDVLGGGGSPGPTSRRMQFPSLVMTMPPMGSRSILSIDRGPSVVRMMLDTALAAAMFPIWAARPDSRLAVVF